MTAGGQWLWGPGKGLCPWVVSAPTRGHWSFDQISRGSQLPFVRTGIDLVNFLTPRPTPVRGPGTKWGVGLWGVGRGETPGGSGGPPLLTWLAVRHSSSPLCQSHGAHSFRWP